MKFNQLILLSLFSLNVNLQGYSEPLWLPQQSNTDRWLNKCSFVDSLNGWAAGEDGVIVNTSNGGLIWNLQNSPVDFFINSIYFLNKRLGWAVANDHFGGGTAVLSTSNGGGNWIFYRYPDTTIALNDIFFKDSLNGIMGGSAGVILRTTNGGANWNLIQTTPGYQINTVKIYNNISLACGGIFDICGTMVKSTNNSLTWNSSCISPEPLFDIVMIDSNTYVSTGGDYEFGAVIWKTTNKGVSWEGDFLNYFGIATAIDKRLKQEWWMTLILSNRFLYTTDSGINWNVYYTQDSSSLFDVVFPDSLHGWAVGDNGKIEKYNPSVIGISNNHQNVPITFSLYQNYPNPFNPSTKIRFEIPKSQIENPKSEIIIYDILGHEVSILINEKLPPGSYEFEWPKVGDASNFPSGIYYYRLTSGNYSETKKMVLIR